MIWMNTIMLDQISQSAPLEHATLFRKASCIEVVSWRTRNSHLKVEGIYTFDLQKGNKMYKKFVGGAPNFPPSMYSKSLAKLNSHKILKLAPCQSSSLKDLPLTGSFLSNRAS